MKTLEDYSINIVMYHYVRPIKGSKHPNIKGLELENFKKRLIKTRPVFNKLKQDSIKQTLNPSRIISDQEFTIYASETALNTIPDGPPIMTLNDLYIPISEVNSYNQINRPTPGDSLDRISRANDQRDTVGRGY